MPKVPRLSGTELGRGHMLRRIEVHVDEIGSCALALLGGAEPICFLPGFHLRPLFSMHTKSAPGPGSPHSCEATGLTPVATCALGPGSPLPHLHWDWAHPLPHLHRGTGLNAATSASWDWAHPRHICPTIRLSRRLICARPLCVPAWSAVRLPVHRFLRRESDAVARHGSTGGYGCGAGALMRHRQCRTRSLSP